MSDTTARSPDFSCLAATSIGQHGCFRMPNSLPDPETP